MYEYNLCNLFVDNSSCIRMEKIYTDDTLSFFNKIASLQEFNFSSFVYYFFFFLKTLDS